MEQTSSLKTVDEICALLKVPRSFIYARTRQRGPDALPVVRVGKYVRFDADAVLAYFKKREGEPG